MTLYTRKNELDENNIVVFERLDDGDFLRDDGDIFPPSEVLSDAIISAGDIFYSEPEYRVKKIIIEFERVVDK